MTSNLVRRGVAQAKRHATMVATMTRAGVVRPHSPVRLAKVAKTLAEGGIGFAGGVAAMALLRPEHPAIMDELGSLTWGQVDERSTRLAHGLIGLGIREGDGVAVLCRNHRYFLEVSTALAKIGADVLYLNTSFSAAQLGEVCARDGASAIVYDEEFDALMDKAGIDDAVRVLAFPDADATRDGSATATATATVEQLIAGSVAHKVPAPKRVSRPIILTSGTTGSPKGAPRAESGLDGAVALLDRMPLRYAGTTHIAAPLFHTWGWAHLNLAMLLGSTVVLRRRFEPAGALEAVESSGADAMVAIPVMLQRILKLTAEQRSGDYSGLRIVAVSGSALPGDLAAEWMDTFGDNLYNTYGSTEVAWATIAQPADMRAAPGTAGRTPPNTVVRIVDGAGREVPRGQSGRIFVGNSMLFAGYTGGGHKEMIDGLMSSGDVGRLDAEGRLFVEGRDDEMIVSGGENVFPKEVEDCLARHERVVEAAAIGVDDDDFGKRLCAFVVTDGDVDVEVLKEWVKDHLARYKVPRDFVFLEELPRNATGKVLKRELASRDHPA